MFVGISKTTDTAAMSDLIDYGLTLDTGTFCMT